MFSVRTRSNETLRALEKIQRGFASGSHLPVLERVAWESFKRLVSATPKRFTGATRAAWQVIRAGDRGYVIRNPSRVMNYLEHGTKAHGPVAAKFLYIPLRAGAMVWHRGLVRGSDYILARRVRGIRAMHIARNEQRLLVPIVRARMRAWVSSKLEGK